MADEVDRQQERKPDAPRGDGDVQAGVRASNEAWREISDRSDATRQNTTNNATTTDRATGSNNQTTGGTDSLNLTNAFTQAQDKFNHFLEAMGWGDKAEGKDKPKQFISAASCSACEIPKDQKGGGGSDAYTSHFRHGDKQTKPDVTLEQMKDGSLKRTSTSKNADGSSLTITTKEEYVRDDKGQIKKDKDGHDMTRVLEKDMEAKNKDGQTTFKSHKENSYNKNGDLEKSHEELERIGKDGKLNKLNSFDVRNEYNEAGKLSAHHATVNDAKGNAIQSTDANYGYDANGNRTTEDITRVRGDHKTTHEHREHTYQQFGENNFQVVKTDSKLDDGGKLTTEYARDDQGVLTGERTIEKDKNDRVRHEFEAAYNSDGSREMSRDVHKTYHENGKEKQVTTSEFNREGESYATRVEKDENGKVVNERGFVQKDDGQIVDQKTGKEMLSADAGQAMGEYWDKEFAWNNLERLSGDATNRDVMSGWDNLGKFAGGPHKQEAAVAKLQVWGQGSASEGVNALEQHWGNGDGQAAQGLDTYLSLGADAAMKEASDKATAGFKNLVHGVAAFWSGAKTEDGKGALDMFAEAGKNFGDAAEALGSTSEKAEAARKLIHKDASVAGDLLTVHGNGACSTGACMIKKDGDEGKAEVPGEPDAVMRGIQANLKWSTTGNFGEATMLRSDIAGGNMIQLRDMTAQMGTTETFENGKVVTHVSRMSGNDAMLQLGREEVPATKPGEAPTVRINPEQAVDQFKRAGIMPDGHYEPMQASKNFLDGGVTTAMTTDSHGRPTPVLDAEGKPVYLHSGERGVEAVLKVGGGSPVVGMDVMTELSSKKNEKGELQQVDMRVGFEQLPKIGETLVATENGKVVPVRDSLVSAQTILNYGEPARDAQGNPVPVRDAQGREIPQGVVGAQALMEVTRTASGTDGARVYESLQAATGNERAMFEKAVAKAAAEGRMESLPTTTFSPAESTRESLQFIGRTEGQTVGSALEGARLMTREQTTPDGRAFTISPDGSVVGGLNAIRQADSAPTEQKTVMGGAQEIALFTARQEGQPAPARVERDEFGFPKPMAAPEAGRGQTFSEGAANTAMMADRTTNVGGAQQPLESSQLFTNGITNVQSYAKDGTFSSGRETVAFIGGGSDRVDSIPRGIEQIRTAADTTTAGSVSQLATVTAAAGGGDPRVGAESMMVYHGRSGEANGSYSEGAKQLYTDLYGAPNAPQNAHQTLQAVDVERAVSIATPGTVQAERLQSGMDKTNEIVRASGNPDLNGSSVLTNLSNNQPAMEVVRQAASPVEARQALEQQGFYQQIVTPVQRNADGTMPTTVTQNGTNTTVAATDANAIKTAEQQKAAVVAGEAALVGNAPAAVNMVVASGSAAVVEGGARREVVAGGNNDVSITAANSMTLNRATSNGADVVAASHDVKVAEVKAAEVKAAEVKAAEVKAAEVKAAEVKAAEVKAAEVKATNDAIANTVRQVLAAALGNNADTREVRPMSNMQQTLGGERGMFKTIGDQVAGSLQSIIAAKTSAASSTEVARATSTSVSISNPLTAKAFNVPVVGSDATAVQRAAAAANNVSISIAAAANGNATLAKVTAAGSTTTAAAAARVGDITALRTGGSVAIGVDGRPMIIRASVSSDNTSSATSTRSMDLMFGRTFRTIGNGIDNAVVKGDLKATKLRSRKFRKLGEDDLAMLGAELALVALLVSSSIAKEKNDKAEAKKKAGAAEFAKASDSAADVVELDKANVQAAYKVLTRPTWLVRKGEDLVKLAEHLFQEAELGWLIADLNMGQTKETYVDGKRVVELKERQRIEIPVCDDIVQFHRSMSRDMAPENLVTIVSENAVDTELMNATLGLAMGATEVARPVAAALPAPKPALVLAGMSKEAKEGDRRPLLATAKRAALSVRRVATNAVAKDQDQGPTAPAVATTEELRPKYV